MRSERFLLLVLCIAWLACTTWAQNSSEGTAGGAPAGVVFKGSDIDNVSMNNGGLTLRIPYSETPGRGLSSGQFLVYNSKGYYMSEYFCSCSTCNYFAKPVKNSQLIPAVASTAGIRVNSSTYQTSCDGGQTNTFIAHGYSVIEPDGTSHHMVPDPQGGWGCQVPETRPAMPMTDRAGSFNLATLVRCSVKMARSIKSKTRTGPTRLGLAERS